MFLFSSCVQLEIDGTSGSSYHRLPGTSSPNCPTTSSFRLASWGAFNPFQSGDPSSSTSSAPPGGWCPVVSTAPVSPCAPGTSLPRAGFRYASTDGSAAETRTARHRGRSRHCAKCQNPEKVWKQGCHECNSTQLAPFLLELRPNTTRALTAGDPAFVCFGERPFLGPVAGAHRAVGAPKPLLGPPKGCLFKASWR